MRNKNRIQMLETQVSELSQQVAMLMEVMTRPERSSELPTENNSDWRSKPRKANKTSNRMKSWSEEDIRLAVTMREKGASNSQIGKVLGRSDRGVSSMFFRYGLDS